MKSTETYLGISGTASRTGVGRPVVVLDSAFGRGGLNPLIASALNDCDLSYLDYQEGLSIHAESRRTLALAEKQLNDAPFNLIGICYGSLVALDLLARVPDKISTVTLIGPLLNKTSSLVASAALILNGSRDQDDEERQEKLLTFFESFFGEEFRREKYREYRVYSALFVQYWARPERFNSLRSRLMEQLSYLDCISATIDACSSRHGRKILLITGDDDLLIPSEIQIAATTRLQSKLTRIEKAGHAVHIERPVECGKLVRAFIN